VRLFCALKLPFGRTGECCLLAIYSFGARSICLVLAKLPLQTRHTPHLMSVPRQFNVGPTGNASDTIPIPFHLALQAWCHLRIEGIPNVASRCAA
jgi:hypothetical protein